MMHNQSDDISLASNPSQPLEHSTGKASEGAQALTAE